MTADLSPDTIVAVEDMPLVADRCTVRYPPTRYLIVINSQSVLVRHLYPYKKSPLHQIINNTEQTLLDVTVCVSGQVPYIRPIIDADFKRVRDGRLRIVCIAKGDSIGVLPDLAHIVSEECCYPTGRSPVSKYSSADSQ